VRLNFAKNPATLHAAGERLLKLKEHLSDSDLRSGARLQPDATRQ